MYNTRVFKSSIRGNKFISEAILRKFLIKKSFLKESRLALNAQRIYNQMIKEPEPLKYKLQQLPENDNTLNEPLGPVMQMPFKIERTHTNNLPVYTEFRNGRQQKVTIVRRIYGDVEEFKNELSKIVSNAPIEDRVGRVEVSGLHSAKIKLWLRRLGF